VRRLSRSQLGELLTYFGDLGAQDRDLFFELGALPLRFSGDFLSPLLGIVGQLARPFSGILNQRVDFARAIVE
jgi:hypothetical protein